VKIDGSDAPIGSIVEAKGEGVIVGIAGNPIVTTEAGIYGGAGPLEPKLVVQGYIADGAIIEFYVNGTKADQTAEWHSGAVTGLDLTVTISGPPDNGDGPERRDTTPPGISDISASNITETSADISWKTNENSTSQVEYWSSPSFFSPLDETLCCNHLVHLTDLTPGTTYHYKTMSMDSAGNMAVCAVSHTFTTLGEVPAAAFSTGDLSISPSEVNIGETVTISISVGNTGGEPGSCQVILKINGAVEATKEVTVDAGKSQLVSFTTAKDVPATYSIDVNGLTGSFTVKKAPVAPSGLPAPAKPLINWALVGGIIAAVVVVALVIFFLARKKGIFRLRDRV